MTVPPPSSPVLEPTGRTKLPARRQVRRRPTGDAPPRPYRVQPTGVWWLLAAALLVAVTLLVFRGGLRGTAVSVTVVDDAVVRWLVEQRALLRPLTVVTSWWTVLILLLGTMLVLLVLRRFRHLLVLLVIQAFTNFVIIVVYELAERPRPFGVVAVGDWAGWAMPALPVGMITVALMGVLYGLVPAGRSRSIGKGIAAVVVAAACVSRMSSGLEAPTDLLVAVVLGVALPLAAFRSMTPNDTFPVVYHRRSTAHLDISGARGDAIRRTLEEQLGLKVVKIAPIGLAGSAGSTPLLVTVAGDPPVELFVKLLAQSHLRSDRWYKLGRELLYGKLEDEAAFASVRRLVEQEDYNLMVLRRAGLPSPASFGIVEVIPNQEYLLVIEFFRGADEISEVTVDESLIDQGLAIVRKLWDAGLAHRDIKPANLLVRDGQLLVIDAGFCQVRPTPWRQAVDLANMMLVLAMRADPKLVYDRALRQFTVDDITEAFAASRGITMPSQLRRMMRTEGRDLHAAFLQLLPERPRPIRIQRWTLRRIVLLTAAVAAVALVAANPTAIIDYREVSRTPLLIDDAGCDVYEPQWLFAQAVPSASRVPCLRAMPAGWSLVEAYGNNARAELVLGREAIGGEDVVILFTPSCTPTGAVPGPRDASGVERFERLQISGEYLDVTWFELFPGGCVRVSSRTTPVGVELLGQELRTALGYTERGELQAELAARSDGRLSLD